jgi:hypothetical protein
MKYFFFAIFFLSSVYAREITFLPTYISGTEPESLKKKDKLEYGFTDLTAFYAKENFFVDISEPDKVKSYFEETTLELNRKPSKLLISRTCEEFSSDYISRNEVSFDKTIVVLTEIYNCRGKLVTSHETMIQNDFYRSLENHIKKSFNFLTPKTKHLTKYNLQNKQEIIFFLDLSGALHSEINEIISLLESITGNPNYFIGLVAVSENKIKIIQPSSNHKQLKSELKNLKFSGDISLERLTSGLIKAKMELVDSKMKSRKFFIITDAKSNKQNDSAYLTAMQSLNEIGYKIQIFTGSFFDHKSFSLHKKASRIGKAKDISQIIHFQTIQTKLGMKTVFLFDQNIYSEEGERSNLQDLNLKDLSKVEEGKLFSYADYPNPRNFTDIYSKSKNLPILEKFQLKSNIRQLVEQSLTSNSSSPEWSGSKALLKVGGTSFWIQLKSISEDFIDKEVTLRATFIKDDFTSTGINNVAAETEIYTEQVPKLLVLEPKQIRNFLESKSNFNCFVTGKILEIK